LAEFYQKWQKRGRTKCWKEIPYFTLLRNTRRQRQNLIFISIGRWVERCIDVKIKLAELFSKLAELFWCTGRKAISGPGNTESELDEGETDFFCSMNTWICRAYVACDMLELSWVSKWSVEQLGPHLYQTDVVHHPRGLRML
jgi:hypothetical protein